MRYLFLLTALLFNGFSFTHAAKLPIDSMRTVLGRTTDPVEKIRIYRNLADMTATSPESCNYLLQLFEAARDERQTQSMMEALTDLTINYIQQDKTDSARYVLTLAEKHAPSTQRDRWCSYLRMRLFFAELFGENSQQAIDNKIADVKQRNIAKEGLYQQIEAEYTLGSVSYQKEEYDDAVKHMELILPLTQQLPFREGAPYQLLILRQLSGVYNAMQKTQKGSELIKTAIEIKERYYNLYDKNERPFYPMDDFYITSYSSLFSNILYMQDSEIKYYLDKLVEMSDKSQNPAHKYNRFRAEYNYSTIKRKFRQSLAINDSLIYYAHRIATYSLPNLYRISSILSEALGDNKRALASIKESYRLQDSIRQNSDQAKYDKLRVEYDVNRLNYENSQLEIRNKHIMLVTLSITLGVVMGLCLFLYYHLRRERRRKEHMLQLKLRAEESEKLKTGFINSICHEIRTPLNGIVGFAGLMYDDSIDAKERASFQKEIQHNTDQLVELIDKMLMVSNLDVSDTKLPCTAADLMQICRNASRLFTTKNNDKDVLLFTDIPENVLTAQTNERLLMLVLDNLLSNAYKFTEKGRVTLSCKREGNNAVISVTDTGCGIAPENHQKVFDRFVKLDTHKQGSGLGLYLCKIIISRLSGSIGIDADYTTGTRVTIVLPLE